MIKGATINTDLLMEKIRESGLKIKYIAKRTGLSVQAFNPKVRGERAFTQPEIIALSLTLNLSPGEVMQIFFNPEFIET